MDLLTALHERIRLGRAADSDRSRPLTIGDVYQRLVPYRTVRGELGVLEFAAYEHALLRLLSGEGGFLEVADARARDEIQRELASLNPILGIYRDYSDAEIRLANGEPPHAVEAAAPVVAETVDDVPLPLADPLAAMATPGDALAGARLPLVDPLPAIDAPEDALAGDAPLRAARCRGCDRSLPDVEDLRFCPYCGEEQGPKPCPACGAPVDPDWSFCARCGVAQGVTRDARD